MEEIKEQSETRQYYLPFHGDKDRAVYREGQEERLRRIVVTCGFFDKEPVHLSLVISIMPHFFCIILTCLRRGIS